MANDQQRPTIANMTPSAILAAVDDALEETGRWTQLLRALEFDPNAGRPGSVLLNNALEKRGFGRPLSETDGFWLLRNPGFPEEWWRRISTATVGKDHSSTAEVVAVLRQRTPAE